MDLPLRQRRRASVSLARKPIGCDLAEPTIDMVGLATSLGVEGHRVMSAKDLAPALEKALASMVPVLLDVVVGEEEYFAPDGTSRVRQGR